MTLISVAPSTWSAQLSVRIAPPQQPPPSPPRALITAEPVIINERTLGEAYHAYIARCRARGRSAMTIRFYEKVIDLYAPDWMDKPLREFGRDRHLLVERHRVLTETRGPFAANHLVKALRAIYGYARRFDPDLPPNPTEIVDYNHEPHAEKVITEWAEWWEATQRLRNPVVRDWYIFLAFTGMRKTSATEVRIRHLDLHKGFLFVPKPKGGTTRAFDLPLSDFVVDLLRRRIEENERYFPGNPWIFPSLFSGPGHLTNCRTEYLPSPHVHRHSYATAAKAAGLADYDIKFLLNHKIADVTGRYLHASMLGEHLKQCQERVTAWLLARMEAAKPLPVERL